MRRDEESRDALRQLLARWQSGIIEPRQVFEEAKVIWLSRRWPMQWEDGYDLVAQEIAFMLGNARSLGITHDDFPALRAYLDDPMANTAEGHQRWLEHFETVDAAARETLQEQDDYYGPRSADDEDGRLEMGLADPDERRIHRGMRIDPESIWDEVRVRLCAPPPRDEMFLTGLIEDLMHDHGAEFIERIEEVVAACPESHATVTMAYVDGIAPTPALERFRRLQQNLSEASGAAPIT